MKTISVYSFSELSASAQQTAINNYVDYGNPYFEDLQASLQALTDLFGISWAGNGYHKIEHIFPNLEDATTMFGVRLYTYISNNYGSDLFTPKFIKTIPEFKFYPTCFIARQYKHAGSYFLYKRFDHSNGCVLTGVGTDMDVLAPVYAFLSRPSQNYTLDNLCTDIANAYQKAYRDLEEYINSEEYIRERLAESDIDYLENGQSI